MSNEEYRATDSASASKQGAVPSTSAEPSDTSFEAQSLTSENGTKDKKPSFAVNAHYFVEVFTLTLCIVLFLTTFLVRHTVVDGASMQNTLQNGQHLLISDLFYTPKRGDIVVFQSPDTGITTPVVKRIVGMPGDKVRLENGTVYLNGKALSEPYVFRDAKNMQERLDMDEITVSAGHVFVMGDHRNKSLDSRYFGEVDIRSILGRAYLRVYPFADFDILD